MGINCTHWMFGRATHGECEYKCVSEYVKIWAGAVLSKRGGADRAMVVIPAKETLERPRGSL